RFGLRLGLGSGFGRGGGTGAEHAGDGAAEKHAAGDPERRLRRAGEETTAAALIAPLVPVPRTALRRDIMAAAALRLQLADAFLCHGERVLLHEDRLCHVIGRAGLPPDLVPDQRFGLGITGLGAALDILEAAKQA